MLLELIIKIQKNNTHIPLVQAQEHGWIWKIPTRYRIGTGYCFNRDINDPDEVAQAFSDQWDGRIKPEDMRLLDWKPQYVKNFWNGNVIPIGLSAGIH